MHTTTNIHGVDRITVAFDHLVNRENGVDTHLVKISFYTIDGSRSEITAFTGDKIEIEKVG